jgi:hypothetical protein
MCKRVMSLIITVTLGLTQLGMSGDIPDLAAWWDLDDGAGTVVLDSSGNGHNGEAFGNPAWVEGIHGGAMEFDGVDDRIEMPTTSPAQGFPATDGEVTWALWFKTGSGTGSRTLIAQGPAGAAHVQGNRSITVEASGVIMMRAHSVGDLTSITSNATVNDNEWHHVAVTLAFETSGTSDTLKFYVDGDLSKGLEVDTINVNQHAGPAADFVVTLGARGGFYDGLIDDVAIFGRALTAEEVVAVMSGRSKELASAVGPGDGTTDVLRDVTLAWNPGEFAVSHDVYLGTALDAVSDGAADTLVSQGQSDTTYDAGVLAFGQTYYWRVDEVNGVPDRTVFKGDVWSFTVEPTAIPIDTPIIATASGSNPGMEPGKTVDGSGLDMMDQHSAAGTDMWLAVTAGSWIQYEFDKAYKLHAMQVWNSNQIIEAFIGFGVKEAIVETSIDGVTWTAVQGVPQFAQAPGAATYQANTTVDLSGMTAKYVKISPQSAYGTTGQAGLSEVRFSAVPTNARELLPEDGSVIAGAEATLTWRGGREAASHQINLGTDPDNLTSIGTTPDVSFVVDGLDYAQTYNWQVVEVNEAETPSTYVSDIQSFTTAAYGVVEDFESYSGKEGEEVFMTWYDGFGGDATLGGSTTGHIDGPFVETATVNSGRQSMPVFYDNDGGFANIDGQVSSPTFSEVLREFDSPQDWTAHNAKSLSLHVHGAAGNAGQLYLKINNTKVMYQGLQDALQRSQWLPWNIDLAATGADLTNVRSLSVGIEGAGSGMIFVDAIRLYPQLPETFEPIVPDNSDAGLVAHYEFEGNANDSQGNYPGTALGDPTYTAGKQGQALSLDNVDDHIVNTIDPEVVWSAYSVSLWVKTDLFNQDIYSSLFNNNSSTSDFQIEVNGSDNYLYRGAATGILGPVSSDWVHLAVSCDGTQTQLYYNGLGVGTANSADTRFGQIAIGINRGMSNRFGGTIDDVRVYDRSLSDAEVAGLAGITDAVPLPF